MADLDLEAWSVVLQTIQQVTPQTSLVALEAIARDASFALPVDIEQQSAASQVILGTTLVDRNYKLELIASAESKTAADITADSVAQEIIFGSVLIDRNYVLEAIGKDNSFANPGDTEAGNVANTVILAAPKNIQNQRYNVEAIGYGITSTDSRQYLMEVISGLPYSSPSDEYRFEIVAKSTIDPPQPQQRSWWFTVT